MTEATLAIAPAPMEGHGAYNRSSRVQAAGASPAIPLLEQAAREAALPPAPEPIVVADYGSSEGHNSLAPMGLAIGGLRRRAGHAPFRAKSQRGQTEDHVFLGWQQRAKHRKETPL